MRGSSIAPIRVPQREAAAVRLAVGTFDFAFGGAAAPVDDAECEDFPVSHGVFEERERLLSSCWRELCGASFVLENVN